MAHFVLLLVLVVAVPSSARPRTQDFARTQGGLQADEKKAQATVEGDISTFEIVGACRANCVEQVMITLLDDFYMHKLWNEKQKR